jgi:RhtB (resistance to homoserine/threonine) family protein
VTLAELGGFLAISALLIVIPGPDMALVARNSLRGGRRSGIATALGVFSGLVLWTLAASVGLAALLRASEPAFVALKIAGSLYLVYLGTRSLFDALRRTEKGDGRRRVRAVERSTVSLRQGLVSNLGNPKIAVFFTSFLPQFVHGHGSAFAPLVVLGLIFVVLTFAWLTLYAVVIGRGSSFLRRPRVRLWLDRFTGVVFVGFGIRLALEKR